MMEKVPISHRYTPSPQNEDKVSCFDGNWPVKCVICGESSASMNIPVDTSIFVYFQLRTYGRVEASSYEKCFGISTSDY